MLNFIVEHTGQIINICLLSAFVLTGAYGYEVYKETEE